MVNVPQGWHTSQCDRKMVPHRAHTRPNARKCILRKSWGNKVSAVHVGTPLSVFPYSQVTPQPSLPEHLWRQWQMGCQGHGGSHNEGANSTGTSSANGWGRFIYYKSLKTFKLLLLIVCMYVYSIINDFNIHIYVVQTNIKCFTAGADTSPLESRGEHSNSGKCLQCGSTFDLEGWGEDEKDAEINSESQLGQCFLFQFTEWKLPSTWK